MKSILGLDIGSKSVKLIELSIDKGIYTLTAAGSLPVPPRLLGGDTRADLDAIANVVTHLVKETGAKTTDVAISFPESQVFTRVIDVPPLSTHELTSAIKWEAEQYIPMPLDQVNLDYTVLQTEKETGTGKMEVLLVAAPKTLIDSYMTILESAELLPIAAETNIIAAARALSHSIAAIKHSMIVSIGSQTTDIAILRNGTLTFARSISAGGEAMTRAIAQSLNFTTQQAEEYKKTYGVDSAVLEGKIAFALKPVTDTIATEVKRAIAFFEQKYTTEKIQAIILAGGSAKLPGLVQFMTNATGIETQLANPWAQIQKSTRFAVLNQEGPMFAVAVGLAMRPE